MSIDLETTGEQRVKWLTEAMAESSGTREAAVLRDLHRVLSRAEWLAKEVERLKADMEATEIDAAASRRHAIEADADIAAAEAKLAVYEAPVPDGEVEELITRINDPEWDADEVRKDSTEYLRRLSRDKAEAEARGAKLREALTAAADNHNKLADEAAHRFHEWHTSACHRAAAAALLGVADAFARAAHASSSPTKEKSDG